MERMIPATCCHDVRSLKIAIPKMAIRAAPPARTMGTAESGPPFWKRRKKKIVPTPTHTPVNSE